MSTWAFFCLALAALAYQKRRKARPPVGVLEHGGEIILCLLFGSLVGVVAFLVLRGLGFDLSAFK